jgi:ABC-type phosphate transport system substrate-binding protein
MKVIWGIVLLAAIALLPASASSGAFSSVQPLASTAPRTSWEGLAIVVNRNNPTANLTLAQLRAIFLGEKKWWSYRRRVALSTMRRGTPERQTVLRVIYKMDDRELDKYFLYEEFKGETFKTPATLKTPADVKKFVVSTPGAVGYLRASDVDGSVKVVRVNGLLPGDDGYPMRLRARPPREPLPAPSHP